MDKTARTAHATHDELLIARLYGDDVSEVERARALDLVAGCPQCGALFADLGAIAAATVKMPVPPRPRDFSLAEADAVRLGRVRRPRLAILGPQLRRSFGGALTALGLVGVLLTSAASLLGSGAGLSTTAYDQRGGNASSAAAEGAGGLNGASYEPVAPAASAAASEAVAYASTQDYSSSQPLAGGSGTFKTTSTGTPVTPNTPPPGPQSSPGSGGEAFGGNTNYSPGQGAEGGIDTRLIWLGGFGTLFVAGLAILLVPRFSRRRRRGAG